MCIVCSPDNQSNMSDTAGDNDDFTSLPKANSDTEKQQGATFMNKFSSLSSAFKSKVWFNYN